MTRPDNFAIFRTNYVVFSELNYGKGEFSGSKTRVQFSAVALSVTGIGPLYKPLSDGAS